MTSGVVNQLTFSVVSFCCELLLCRREKMFQAAIQETHLTLIMHVFFLLIKEHKSLIKCNKGECYGYSWFYKSGAWILQAIKEHLLVWNAAGISFHTFLLYSISWLFLFRCCIFFWACFRQEESPVCFRAHKKPEGSRGSSCGEKWTLVWRTRLL